MIRLALFVSRHLPIFSLLRLCIAVFILWIVLADTGPRLARLQFSALPDFDHAAEIAFLRTAGRYGEALMVAEAGLEAARTPEAAANIVRERNLTLEVQASLARRARDVGMGALSGRGHSLESLAGAVAADFFIVGDVRDLVLEGGRFIIDGETDEVILALSAIGIVTTAVPQVDWAPAVLKFARRAGTLTSGLAEQITRLARSGSAGRRQLAAILDDLRRIADRASPGGAVRLLRHADSAEDLSALARFVEANRRGAFALHVTGKQGADLVKAGARSADGGAEATQAVLLAATKGSHGAAWLRAGSSPRTGWRSMLRPHPLIGITKGLWKGNLQDLSMRIASIIDPWARFLLPFAAAWVFVELALLARRFSRFRPLGHRRAAASSGRPSMPQLQSMG